MTSEEFANYIQERTVRIASIKTSQFAFFDKPIVYMVLGKNKVLYVGMSSKGISRAFRNDHHVLSQIHKYIRSISLFETRTIDDARKLEKGLIREFQPAFNERGMPKKIWGAKAIIDYMNKDI